MARISHALWIFVALGAVYGQTPRQTKAAPRTAPAVRNSKPPASDPSQSTRDLKYAKDEAAASTSKVPLGKRYALVVGISEYENLPPQSQLRFANRDAEEFARFLRSEAGGAIPASDLLLLTDRRATVGAIRAALHTWLPQAATRNDTVYLFFAGHGVIAEGGEGYFVAHDSDPQNLHATGVSFREVNETLTSRLKAGTIILLADACHAGTIGWSTESAVRGNAQSAIESLGARDQAFLKLLASRPSERSFEDARWDGGHGVFTFALLSGLRGAAERDKDGSVRVSNLIDYVSRFVPEQTQRQQNPRVAGNFEPALVLSRTGLPPNPSRSAEAVAIEVSGPAGTAVYVDRVYRGSLRASGDLRLDNLLPAEHRIEVDLPTGDSFGQSISAATTRHLDIATLPGFAITQLRAAIRTGKILEAGGAWDFYRSQPFAPEYKGIADAAISSALEDVGQGCVNDYVQSTSVALKAKLLNDAAEAYRRLQTIRPGDRSIEARRNFCEGRANIAAGKFDAAVKSLETSLQIDPNFACAHNAMGVALARLGKKAEARASFERAFSLTPEWFLPPLQIAQILLDEGDAARAVPFLEKAVRYNPRSPFAAWTLMKTLRSLRRTEDFAKVANETIRKFPNYAPSYLEIAAFHESRQDYPRAAQAYDAYLTLAPNFADSAAIKQKAARDRTLANPPSLVKKAGSNKN